MGQIIVVRLLDRLQIISLTDFWQSLVAICGGNYDARFTTNFLIISEIDVDVEGSKRWNQLLSDCEFKEIIRTTINTRSTMSNGQFG